MSPADRIDSAVRFFEHARSSLDARSDQEIVAALAKVFDLWRDPNSDCRRELEARLPDAAGFTSETVRAGLNVGFEPWTGDAFTRLVINELGAIPERGRRTAVGHPLTSVVLAGSIPMPSLLSIVLPLVLRSPVLCKPASRDLVTASLVAESIHTVDPLLGDCVAIVPFEKEDTTTARAFFASPCVVVTGSSETIQEVESQLGPNQTRLFYGHRVSVGAVNVAAIDAHSIASLTQRLAVDVSLWDQLGCLSPTHFYLVGGSDAQIDNFASSLAAALEAYEKQCPRGEITIDAAAGISRERSEAQMRNALGHNTRVLASEGTQWTVVTEHDATLRAAPLHRFIRLSPVADTPELINTIAPMADVLAGVVLAGFTEGRAALARDLKGLGASRICEPGELQAPPLDWPRDNQPVLRAMIATGANRAAFIPKSEVQ